MTRAELEKKSLSELHKLAAEAGVERYRMLPRAELVAKLADGDSGAGDDAKPAERAERSQGERPQDERPARRRRSRGGRGRGSGSGEGGRPREGSGSRERKPRGESRPEPEVEAEPAPEPPAPQRSEPVSASAAPGADSSPRPRRRRRRRFGRRGKQGVTLQGLLLPPAGRQALLAAETREACTALLRGIAADLSEEKGPDPVALLVDPSPEELADWRRDAPRAEIVAAGQPRHASDALAQARTRANSGEDVILLVDSLTRLGEAYEDADAAKEFYDAAGGNLTVVAAVERPST